jgi:hypothetical protein
MLEVINHPVDVLGLFSDGRIRPLRFRWRRRVVRVRRITGEWTRREGVGTVRYFSVLADNGDYFELALEVAQHQWRVCRVWLEG